MLIVVGFQADFTIDMDINAVGDGGVWLRADTNNGATSGTTTLTNNSFTSGQVGLYDYSSQTFDNVVVRSEGPCPLHISRTDSQRATLSPRDRPATGVAEGVLSGAMLSL